MYTGTDFELYDALNKYSISNDDTGCTDYPTIPLHQAVEARRVNVVKKLLEHDSGDLVDGNNNSSLHIISTIPDVMKIANILSFGSKKIRTLKRAIENSKKMKLSDSISVEILKEIAVKRYSFSKNILMKLDEKVKQQELIIASILIKSVLPENRLTLLHRKSKNELSPLHFCVIHEKLNVIKLLLDNHIDSKTTMYSADIVFKYAVLHNSIKIIKEINHWYPCYKIHHYRRSLSLIDAINMKDIKMVSYLLEIGLDTNIIDRTTRKAALHHVIDVITLDEILKLILSNANEISNVVEIIRLLISYGANVNIVDASGNTPLHYATRILSLVQIVYTIVDNSYTWDAELSIHDITNIICSDYVTKILKKYGDNDDSISNIHKYGYKILTVLSDNMKDNSIKLTRINMFAKITPIMDIIKVLLDNGGRLVANNKFNITPLYNIVSLEFANEIISNFLEDRIDFNERNERNITPLHHASSLTDGEKAVKTLLEHGAHVNAEDSIGATPLHNACYVAGSYEIAKLLIDNGADVNATDKVKITPLHNACCAGGDEIVKLLIQKGAKIDARDIIGNTPLHEACSSNMKRVVELLLSLGANVNASLIDGTTTLHCAAPYPEIVRILIDNSANVNTLDRCNNMTPIEYAIDSVRCMNSNSAIISATEMVTSVILDAYRFPYITESIAFKRNMQVIDRIVVLSDLKQLCEEEIKKIRSIKITSKYSLYTYLTNNIKLQAIMVNNSTVTEIDLDMFSVYKRLLEKNIRTAKKRINIIFSAIEHLNTIISSSYWSCLPFELKEEIISLLGNEDLKSIVA